MIRASLPTRRSAGSRLLVPAFLSAAFVVVAGCAAGAAGGGGGGGGGGGNNPDLITAEQVASRVDGNAEELIQSLRPGWFRPRTAGTLSSAGPVMPEVFIDGSYYGPIDFLRNIPTTSIDHIEFIGASDATTLYGTGYMGGVIHVHTRTAG
jgi:hypothetical protein